MLKTVGNPSTRYGNQTIVDGNLVIGTAGYGIDFSANPNAPGADSELLNDYETGTFTASLVAGAGSFTLNAANQTCRYVKVGRVVHVLGYLLIDSASVAPVPSGGLLISGLPFNLSNGNQYFPSCSVFINLSAAITGSPVGIGYANTNQISLRRMSGGSATDDLAGLVGAGTQIIFQMTYVTN